MFSFHRWRAWARRGACRTTTTKPFSVENASKEFQVKKCRFLSEARRRATIEVGIKLNHYQWKTSAEDLCFTRRCVPWRWLGVPRLSFSAYSNSSASHWRNDARARWVPNGLRTACAANVARTCSSRLCRRWHSIRFIRIHHTIYSTAWNSPYAKWIPRKKSEKLSPYVIIKRSGTATARGTGSHSK